MTTFEYIAVLVSIIVGLSLTHLLGGVGRIIGNPGCAKVYWVHLVWTLYAFVYLVAFWWWEYQLSTVEVWTVQLYLFLVLYLNDALPLVELLLDRPVPIRCAG